MIKNKKVKKETGIYFEGMPKGERMKKNLNLFQLSRNDQRKVEGGEKNRATHATASLGCLCGCGCRYADSGGSSSGDNGCANSDQTGI
ncbi:MAG: hypothetical protein GY765_06985 [bacterium]|nr:hypothetical protein [bacterium]